MLFVLQRFPAIFCKYFIHWQKPQLDFLELLTRCTGGKGMKKKKAEIIVYLCKNSFLVLFSIDLLANKFYNI